MDYSCEKYLYLKKRTEMLDGVYDFYSSKNSKQIKMQFPFIFNLCIFSPVLTGIIYLIENQRKC